MPGVTVVWTEAHLTPQAVRVLLKPHCRPAVHGYHAKFKGWLSSSGSWGSGRQDGTQMERSNSTSYSTGCSMFRRSSFYFLSSNSLLHAGDNGQLINFHVDKHGCLTGQLCVTPKWKPANDTRVNDKRNQQYNSMRPLLSQLSVWRVRCCWGTNVTADVWWVTWLL